MSIKPNDIINASFTVKVRGYAKEEVDEFLRQVADSMTAELEQNVRINEKLAMLESEVNRFKEIESSLNSVLVLAQKSADDLRNNASKEAEIILKEAKINTAAQIEHAKLELEDLKNLKHRFEIEFCSLLHTYLDIFEGKPIGRESENPQ